MGLNCFRCGAGGAKPCPALLVMTCQPCRNNIERALARLSGPPPVEFRGSFSKIWHGPGLGIHRTGECNVTSGEILNAK